MNFAPNTMHGSGRNSVPPPYTLHPESRTNETEPLLPRQDDQNYQCPRGKVHVDFRWAVLYFLFITFVGLVNTSEGCPEAAEMDRNRSKWALEKRVHDEAVAGREEVYQLWRTEDATHATKLKYWDEENLERDGIRKEWNREAREHEEVRRQWKEEVGEYEREKRERRKKEAEERQRMGLFWVDVEASHCVRHETRKYTARLAGAPDGFEYHVEACKESELSISGKSMTPTRCDDKGVLGMYGIWEVEGDAACGTYFSEFGDKGCTAPKSGLRKYEMHMQNLRPDDDWEVMCSSTPAAFLETYFAHPDTCTRAWSGGVYGFWNIKDTSCW